VSKQENGEKASAMEKKKGKLNRKTGGPITTSKNSPYKSS